MRQMEKNILEGGQLFSQNEFQDICIFFPSIVALENISTLDRWLSEEPF